MNLIDLEPKYLKLTKQWVFKFCLIWAFISFCIGTFFLGIIEGIVVPFITVSIIFVSSWVFKIVLLMS